MTKVVSAILPIAGAVIGSVIPGVGTAIGATLGGAVGGLGAGILNGQGFGGDLMSMGMGALGGYMSGGSLGNLAQTAGSMGPSSILSNAADPIEAISNAMTVTGTSTAGEAAQALGYSNVNGMLAAGNPAWLNTAPMLQGMVSNATGGMIGGGAPIGSIGGTAGPVGGIANNALSPAAKMMGSAASRSAGLGPISSLMSMGSGIYGLSEAAKLQKLTDSLAQTGQYSTQYAEQLSNLMKNPSSITSMPGFEAGQTAVERSMAAQGYQGSGNMAAALQQYGGNFFNQQVQQLQELANSGASSTQAALGGQQMSNSAASQALAALGYGAAGLGF